MRQTFRSNDARDPGEVVGDANGGPVIRIEKRLHYGEAIVTEFSNKNTSGL